VWKRTWKAILKAWSLYRHGTALKGLLESLGIWKWAVFLVAAVMSAVYTAWSGLSPEFKVLAGLGGFAGLLFVAGFGMVFVRVWKMGAGSMPSGDVSAVAFQGEVKTKVIRGLKPPDPPPPLPLSGLAESLSNQFLQATEEEIPVQLRAHREGIVISVRQVLSSEKALPARIVVSDIRPLQDGKRITSRLLHSNTGRFSYDAIQLQRAPAVQGDLHYGEEGVWWLVCPIRGMQNLTMFWPDRPGFRAVPLQPGEYIAELRIWVGDRNLPFQTAWRIDAEQIVTISSPNPMKGNARTTTFK
jgi:hypothetical protein